MKNLFNELSFRFRLMFLLAVLLLIVNLPLFYIINASIETDQSEMRRRCGAGAETARCQDDGDRCGGGAPVSKESATPLMQQYREIKDRKSVV